MKKKRGKRLRYFVEVKKHYWVSKLNKWVLNTEEPIKFEYGFSTSRTFRTINTVSNHLNYLNKHGYKFIVERYSRYKGRRRVQTWTND
jgi:16S rRNA G527 N7-methylase RsmG